MPAIKNVSGDDRIVPYLNGRRVLAGQLVDVEPGDVYSFTCQEGIWAPADADAKAEHKAAGSPPSKKSTPAADDVAAENQEG